MKARVLATAVLMLAASLLITAKVFDAQRAWRFTASMTESRELGAALLLHDGRVIVAGGHAGAHRHASTEFYHPASESWSDGPVMATARTCLSMSLLPDGRVLIAGGMDSADQPLASSEIYSPLSSSIVPGPAMATARGCHTATTLPDGRILVLGGASRNPDPYLNYLEAAEVYNPASNTWSALPPMQKRRLGHSATLLGDGRVLVVGGVDWADYHNTAEILDLATNTWSPLLQTPYRWAFHIAWALPGGQILFAGGHQTAARSMFFDPRTLTWAPGPALNTARKASPAQVQLTTSTLLLIGGYSEPFSPTSATEVFDAVAKRWTTLDTTNVERSGQIAVLLPDGRVLTAGGVSTREGASTDSAELFELDTTPPQIDSVTVDPAILWPPDHTMRHVSVSVAVRDAVDAAPGCRVISVFSNEPSEGRGDGDRTPDYYSVNDTTVALRAERAGAGTGRAYTLTVQCKDSSDNASTATATVRVPISYRER